MKKNNKKGFTLVELVIVVAVMAILVAVAIPTIGSIRESAQTNVQNSNAQTIESMIKLAESRYDDATDQNIADELADAKLGITTGSYAYNPTTGECKYGSAASGEVAITFSTTGVTYAGKTGNAANALANKTE